MSLFWSQWAPAYFNEATLKWLSDDWKCTIIRAPLGVEADGYLKNPTIESQKITTVIDAGIKLGIYVIVDWHEERAENHTQEAKAFFNAIASKYGKYPHIIYEIYNEPLNVSWKQVIKPYAEQIINTIRAHAPHNLIIVGTRNWSQDVDDVIGNRIDDPNVLYSLHFYTGTHRQWLRDKATKALAAGIPIFASEWGLSDATAGGTTDQIESAKWLNYLDANNLGSCNWAVNNKNETPSALRPTTTALSGWKSNELSLSGQMVRDYLIQRNSIYFK
jgi:endoglucanase